ncbi:hypothetical protein D3C80_1157220 [compost metagenome]
MQHQIYLLIVPTPVARSRDHQRLGRPLALASRRPLHDQRLHRRQRGRGFGASLHLRTVAPLVAIQHLAKGFARLIRFEIEQDPGLGAALSPPLTGPLGRLLTHLLQAARRRLFTALRLRQPGAASSLQFGLLRQKCLKRQVRALQPLLAQLQNLSGLIEQAPVVTHQQIATTVAGQSLAQPLDATGIQVVVRLIEQQEVIWPGKQCQQAQAGELATAQGADRGMDIESEARLCQQVGKIAAQVPAITQQLKIV